MDNHSGSPSRRRGAGRGDWGMGGRPRASLGQISEDDGFEKVESWMVPPLDRGGDGVGAQVEGGSGARRSGRGGDDDSLLVPFASDS